MSVLSYSNLFCFPSIPSIQCLALSWYGSGPVTGISLAKLWCAGCHNINIYNLSIFDDTVSLNDISFRWMRGNFKQGQEANDASSIEWLWDRRVEYWAIRSSARSSARTAHSFALRCGHSFARSLSHSRPSSWKRGLYLWNECVDFISFQPTVRSCSH